MKHYFSLILMLLIGLPAGASTTLLPETTAPSGTTIELGAVLPLTGSQASFGVSAKHGLELAVDRINEKGGVRSRKLHLEIGDDNSRPEDAIVQVRRLAGHPQVITIIGEVGSSSSIAMASLAQHLRIPMVTPTATSPSVTSLGNYIFRTCVIDPVQGQLMALFARRRLKLKRVAVLEDATSQYSDQLAAVFEEHFQGHLGGQIIAREVFDPSAGDVRPQLRRIKELKPDALFVPAYYTDVALIARQAHELGLGVPLLGGDGWASSRLEEIAGAAIEGSYYIDHEAPDDPDSAYQDFVRTYRSRYGEAPDSVAAQAYLTIQVLADALVRSTEPTRFALRDALAATRSVPTIGGALTIDPQRNALKPMVVLKVGEHGRVKMMERVSP